MSPNQGFLHLFVIQKLALYKIALQRYSLFHKVSQDTHPVSGCVDLLRHFCYTFQLRFFSLLSRWPVSLQSNRSIASFRWSGARCA